MAAARSSVAPPLAAALLLAACCAATTPLPNGEEGGNGWHFAGLPWNTSSGGVITAPGKGPSCGGKTTAKCPHPTNNSDVNVAFHTTAAYEEFEVSFDFTISVPFTAAGLVFGAHSMQDYKVVFMAENGIEARDDFAVAFVADVDGSGWARGLYSERLADVTSAAPYTHHLRARLQGGVLETFIDGHPIAPVRLAGDGASAGCVGLLTYNLLSSDPPGCSFSNLNITQLSSSSTSPFDPTLPSKMGTAWRGIPSEVAPASGGAPGVGRSALLPSTGEVVVPTGGGLIVSADKVPLAPLPLLCEGLGPGALVLTRHLLCSIQGKSWRKLDCSDAGILGNCATVSHMSLRGSNLHNQLKHLEGYVLSPSTISKSNEHAIMVKKYTSTDGVKWEQLPHAAILINASQLERAVCTVRPLPCCFSRAHLWLSRVLALWLLLQGNLSAAAEASCLASMQRNGTDGKQHSLVEDWPPDPGMMLETPDGTLVWVFSFTTGAKIVHVNGRS